MATSGTYTMTLTADELVTHALHTLGVLNAEAQADAAQLKLGKRFLFLGLQALKSDGIVLRTLDRYTQALTTGQAYVTPPAETISVEGRGASVWDGTTDRPLQPYSAVDYQALPDKTVPGIPVYFFTEKLTTGALKVWLYPVPDGTATTITYRRQRRHQDVDQGNLEIDLDPAWLEPVSLFLAHKFGRHYRLAEAAEEIWQKYQAELTRVENDETPHGDGIFMLPSTGWEGY